MQGPLIVVENPDTEKEEQTPGGSCLGCVFADTVGNQQKSCEFGRLERFSKTSELTYIQHKYLETISVPKDLIITSHLTKENYEKKGFVLTTYYNGSPVYLSEEIVDEPNLLYENGYFVVNGRYCNYYRDEAWATKHGKLCGPSVLPILKNKVKEENQLRMTVVIYLDDSNYEQQLRDTLKSLVAQTILPIEVIVLNNQNEIKVSEVLKEELGVKIEWRNSKCMWANANLELCFDEAIKYVQGSYYTLINAHVYLKPDFIEQLDISLNTRLDRWILLTHSEIMVAQTKITKFLEGFQEIKPTGHTEFIHGIDNKIKWFAKSHDKEYLVKNLKELVIV